MTPVNYVDSSYARCKDTYKSMEGSIFMVTEEPVLYEYKHQATVALSTVEVKYMRFSQVTAQAIWLVKFFDEIGLPTTTPIHIYANNMGSITNTVNGKNYRRTMHIDVKYHFTKKYIKLGIIVFEYTFSNKNLADLFTKPLL